MLTTRCRTYRFTHSATAWTERTSALLGLIRESATHPLRPDARAAIVERLDALDPEQTLGPGSLVLLPEHR